MVPSKKSSTSHSANQGPIGSVAISARFANSPCQTVVSLIPYPLYKSLAAAMPAPWPSLITKNASEIAQFLCNISPFRINTCKSVSKQRTLTAFRMNTYEKQGGRGVPRSRPSFAAQVEATSLCSMQTHERLVILKASDEDA